MRLQRKLRTPLWAGTQIKGCLCNVQMCHADPKRTSGDLLLKCTYLSWNTCVVAGHIEEAGSSMSASKHNLSILLCFRMLGTGWYEKWIAILFNLKYWGFVCSFSCFLFFAPSTQAAFGGNKTLPKFCGLCLCLWPLSSAVHSHTDSLQSHWARYTWTKCFFQSSNAWDKGYVHRFFQYSWLLNPPCSPSFAVPVCLFVGCFVLLCFYSCRVEVLLQDKVLSQLCFDFEAVLDTGIHISLSQLFATTGCLWWIIARQRLGALNRNKTVTWFVRPSKIILFQTPEVQVKFILH